MPRLTPERTAEADAIAHFYPAVERDINRNLIMSARVLDLLDAIDERIEVERRTVATLTARAEQAEKDIATFGIIELMVRNPNVDSFVREHEKRTEQAERDRDTLARLAHAWNLRDQRQEEHDATSIASDGTKEALEDAESALREAWRNASGALVRSKESP